MSAFNYYLQALSLASTCNSYAMSNSQSIDYTMVPTSAVTAGTNTDTSTGSTDSSSSGNNSSIQPVVLFIIIIGAVGLFIIIQFFHP